jgi:hypothetical protein
MPFNVVTRRFQLIEGGDLDGRERRSEDNTEEPGSESSSLTNTYCSKNTQVKEAIIFTLPSLSLSLRKSPPHSL